MERVGAADYLDLIQVSDPKLSPDGERVAFVRTVPADDESYEATVCVAPLGDDGGGTGGDDAGDDDAEAGGVRPLTDDDGRDAAPRWSPDGSRIAYTSTYGDGEERAQLWVRPVDGGEATRVTDVAGDVSSPAWSPDGTRIAFAQRSTPGERERGLDLDLAGATESDEPYEREPPDPRVIDRLVYRADARYFDGTRSHVYVVDVETGSVERLTDGDIDFRGPDWVDDTTLYYLVEYRDATEVDGERPPDDGIRYDVVAHDLETGTAETLVETTDWDPAIAATADGRVAYTYKPEERATLRQRDLCVHDPGADETLAVTADVDRTVDGAPRWSPDGREVYFLTPDEGHVVLRRAAVDADGVGEPEEVVAEGHLADFSVGDDAVAFVRSAWDHRGDVFATTRDGGPVSRLTEVNAGYLDGRAVGEPEEVRFSADEGPEIQGWVLTPPDFDPDRTYPLAVEIHGGPHAMWTTSGTMWHEFQTLAARGYVVFWCNPRGSTGYGEAFMAANERDWGDVTMADVVAGVDLVAERPYVDEENLFVTGGSFGGYMTGWIVGHTDRFRAAVAQRGVYELSSFYGSTDAFKLVEWDFGTAPWEEPSFLWERSPAAYADDVTTPTLVIHADADYRVPVNNGELFYLFLRRNGVETRLVRYPRDGHELSRSGEPGHVVDRIERIVRWFDGYSDHHDVPPAVEREDDGLTAGAEHGHADGDGDADRGEDGA